MSQNDVMKEFSKKRAMRNTIVNMVTEVYITPLENHLGLLLILYTYAKT